MRRPLPVSHRPIWPPVSPAASVWPSGLNATLKTGPPSASVAARRPVAGVPQADMAARVPGRECLAVRAERHADDRAAFGQGGGAPAVAVSHRPIWPPVSPAASVWPSGLNATLTTGLPSARVAVRWPVAVSHRPIWPPSSPAASVWPSGLNATAVDRVAFGQRGGAPAGCGVPQADIAARVAGRERPAVRAERHAFDSVAAFG